MQANAVNTKGQMETVTLVTAQEIAKGREIWQSIKESTIERREQVNILGSIMNQYKQQHFQNHGKNISNQEFGAWRKEVWPDMPNEYASNCMSLNENYAEITKWAAQHAPELASPKHLVLRWKQYKRNAGKKPEVVKRGAQLPGSTSATDSTDQTEPIDTFQSLSKDGKIRLNEMARKLTDHIGTIMTELKNGHRLDPAVKAKLNNRIEQLVIMLDE